MMDPPPGLPRVANPRVIRICAWLDWEGVLEYFGQKYFVSRLAIQGAETQWLQGVKLYKIVVAVY